MDEDRLAFAGWRVVAVMFLVTGIVFGTAIYGFIILTQPISAEHGWSQATSGSLVSAMWLTSPLALVCAPIIDRVGAWRLLLLALLILAATLAAVTTVSDFRDIYALRIMMGAGNIFAVVSVPVIVSQWFSKRFSLAVALAWCGGAFGGLLLSPVTELLIGDFGWQRAAFALSGLVLLIAALVAWTYRRSAAARRATAGASAGQDENVGEAAEPAAAKTDWRQLRSINVLTAGSMALAVTASGIAALAFSVEIPPLMQASGFSTAAAATILGISAAGAMLGNLIAGWSLDRLKSHWTSLGAGLMIASGLLAIGLLHSHPLILLAGAGGMLFGAGIGASEILWITLTRRQFGAAVYPVTYGAWNFFYSLGYALGGGVGGSAYEMVSHARFLLFLAGLCAPTIVVSLWRPGRRNEEEPAPDVSIEALSPARPAAS